VTGRSESNRQLHLNVNILPSGSHPAAWYAPGGHPRGFIEPPLYQQVAQIAEAGLLDAVFLADSLALPASVGRPPWALDPIVLLTAMATRTSLIGLIGSASTTFSQPYTLARAFLSVDHVAQGRVGWNIVTTNDPEAAENFGDAGLPDKSDRYDRAAEFLSVVQKLWRGWEDDALVTETETRTFARRDRIHPADHHGRFYDVSGPLSFPRSKQGDPLIVQAGGSPEGRDLAARCADAVFNAQHTIAGAQAYYSDLKNRALRQGRDPSAVKVLPGVEVVVGRTSRDAWRRKRHIDGLVPREIALSGFAARVGVDPTELDWDSPFPEHLKRSVGAGLPHGFGSALLDAVAVGGTSVGELIRGGAGAHRILVGSVEDVADAMQLWFENGAADGFNINVDVFPEGLERFVELLIPELQRRGLFRREYEEDTLRERYAR
jgi:FMN-dependent oxidoreductase (nitrilotriacetate monooxygenase family)